jgi:hypothetical protein
MREIRSSGSVEGVVSNHDPYSDLTLKNGLSCIVRSATCAEWPPEIV